MVRIASVASTASLNGSAQPESAAHGQHAGALLARGSLAHSCLTFCAHVGDDQVASLHCKQLHWCWQFCHFYTEHIRPEEPSEASRGSVVHNRSLQPHMAATANDQDSKRKPEEHT